MSRFLQVYSETGIEKTPIKYNKTGCELYVPEICVELNGLSDAREKLKIINDELVGELELSIGYIKEAYDAMGINPPWSVIRRIEAALLKAKG